MARRDRPIIKDRDGTRRFKGNPIVRFLLDEATEGRKCDLNRIWQTWGEPHTRQDLAEFYQLIGYSLSGYAEIFPRSKVRATSTPTAAPSSAAGPATATGARVDP